MKLNLLICTEKTIEVKEDYFQEVKKRGKWPLEELDNQIFQLLKEKGFLNSEVCTAWRIDENGEEQEVVFESNNI